MQQTEERSLGALFSELAKETGTLVRQEAALAKTEMVATTKHAAREGLIVGIGGVLGALGALGIFAALVLVLGMVLPLWGAALLVGAVFASGGAAVAHAGIRRLRRVDLTPRITIKTFEENKKWLTEEVAR